MIDSCIFDRLEQCSHNCPECAAFALQCVSCGKEVDDAPLFDICGETLCLDCLVESCGSDLYGDFAERYSEQFRDFVAECHEDDSVC